MKVTTINRQIYHASYNYPVKAVQIGEGNFIRAFIDWMVDQCNEQGYFQGSIAVTQPRVHGAPKLEKLKQQDGLFTMISRGIVDGTASEEHRVVASISQAIDPYREWESFLKLADNPDVEYVFSNTTEAGITYQPEKGDFSKPIHSFPGKLTAFLYRRYLKAINDERFKGMIIIPCELLDRAGDDLRAIVLQHAEEWGLEEGFRTWVQKENRFLNSIVDRIVTGYPHGEAEQFEEQLGYHDTLLTVAEPYYQWVIEGNEETAKKLPFHKAGLNVQWVTDLSPYMKRKVRILNGTHTYMVPIAFLQGYDTVREAINDTAISNEVQEFLTNWVLPTLPFSKEELQQYVQQTFDRFRNPYIRHQLLDIAMNSTSKFCTRLLPTLLANINERETLPYNLLKSLAYLILFYRCQQDEKGRWLGWRRKNGSLQAYELKDADQVLTTFRTYWEQFEQEGDVNQLVKNILSSSRIWPTPVSDCGIHANVFEQICEHTSLTLASLLEDVELNRMPDQKSVNQK